MKGFVLKLVLPWMVLLIASVPAQGRGLTSRINAIISRKDYAKADFAVSIVKADTGKSVFSRQSKKLMIPASNMKILTSAAALAYLGPDYTFKTKIGVRSGNLIVIGGGDPLLGDKTNDQKYSRKPGWIFDDIIAGLKEKGLSQVNDIIVDSTFFDDMRVHPSWPAKNLNQPYSCEVSGINYNDNCLLLTVRRSNGRVIIIVDPHTSYLTLINKVRLTSSGNSDFGAYRNSKPNVLSVTGKCRKERSADIAIENPAMMFGTMLKEKLTRAGIDIRGTVVEKHAGPIDKVAVFRTYQTPMSDVLMRCNKDSLNMAAEALVKTLSAEHTKGRINGQWEHGFKMVGMYLSSLGISADQYKLDDGCGLSRDNRISANVLVGVLRNIYNSPAWADYKNSLAIGGVDGTIRKYFKEEQYKGKIIGKTGYINGVRTFSGVAHTPGGDYIFSILTSGGTAKVRTGINDIAKAIINN
jgi:D-alanyl-D-alanine carboxypeptidase/D-alanyl-D-alanine-endopeptidase (penicillin-binding protein 4)